MRLGNAIRRGCKILIAAIPTIMIVHMIISMDAEEKLGDPLAKLSNSVKHDHSSSADLGAMKRGDVKSEDFVDTSLSKSTSSKVSLKASPIFPDGISRNVFYNRIGKCASRSLVEVVKAIAKRNSFTAVESSNYWDDHPDNNLMIQEIQKISQFQPLTFYNRHIHYLDFQNFSHLSPIYINMVRDPISRFVSAFNYMKYGDEEGKVLQPYKKLSHINQCVLNNEAYCIRPKTPFYYTNYFCGFDPICNGSSPIERVKLAIKHIDENYWIVGLTEEFENTLKLLEKMIPEYFLGASNVWELIGKSMKSRSKTKRKDVPNEEVLEKLRYQTFPYEYMIYNHVKSKFHQLKVKYGVS